MPTIGNSGNAGAGLSQEEAKLLFGQMISGFALKWLVPAAVIVAGGVYFAVTTDVNTVREGLGAHRTETQQKATDARNDVQQKLVEVRGENLRKLGELTADFQKKLSDERAESQKKLAEATAALEGRLTGLDQRVTAGAEKLTALQSEHEGKIAAVGKSVDELGAAVRKADENLTDEVAFFNRRECPQGWSEYEDLRGRYLVGLPEKGTLEGKAGTALTDLENRPTGDHVHVSNAALRQRVEPSNGSGAYLEWTQSAVGQSGTVKGGATAGTNAPYLQLLACRKK